MERWATGWRSGNSARENLKTCAAAVLGEGGNAEFQDFRISVFRWVERFGDLRANVSVEDLVAAVHFNRVLLLPENFL